MSSWLAYFAYKDPVYNSNKARQSKGISFDIRHQSSRATVELKTEVWAAELA